MGLDIFQNFHPGKIFDQKLFFLEISRIFRPFFKNLVFTLKTITAKMFCFRSRLSLRSARCYLQTGTDCFFWKSCFGENMRKKCDFILRAILLFFKLILSIFRYISSYLHNPFSIMRGSRGLLFFQLVVLLHRSKRHSNSFWAHRMFEISSHKMTSISSIYELKLG